MRSQGSAYLGALITLYSFASHRPLVQREHSNIFDEFDNDFIKASKQDKIQIYHELKGIYLSSILNDNDKLKLECLKRLVSGGKSLGIDYSAYAKELEALSPKASNLKPQIVEVKKPVKTKNETIKNNIG